MIERPLSYAAAMREVMLEWYPEGAGSLAPHLRHTLHALMVFADTSGVAWVDQERLALFMGVQPKQVYRRLAELRKLGVLEPPRFRRLSGGGRSYGHPILRPTVPVE